ncbi:hypothetical protein [Pleomorphovibrio marinus]|uniref:hypothetical protein n=1 Tax=Pleomorphovibrio marinus TaxID=2164132 RepID=UPI000E0CA89D|nr:hypothetical protein [Pleomorphovibrio marinus]
MATFHTIAALVKGLSKAERRNINRNLALHSKGIYVWIYRFISHHPDDLAKLKRAFKEKFPDSSLSMGINHLYDQLMYLIGGMEKSSNPESRIIFYLQQVRLLYERGIYDASLQMVAKAIALGEKHELYGWLLISLRLKLMLTTTTRFYTLEEKELLALYNDIQQTLNYLHTQSQHELQYELLHMRRTSLNSKKGVNPEAAIEDLAMHEKMVFSTPRYQSLEAEKLHLMFQVEYFLTSGNTATSLRVASKLNEHFDQHHSVNLQASLHYITHICGVLQNLSHAGDFGAMRAYEEKLYDYTQRKGQVQGLANYALLHFGLQRCITLSEMEELGILLEKAMTQLEKPIPSFAWEYEKLLTLSVGIAHFLRKDMKKANKYLGGLTYQKASMNLAPVIYTAFIVQLLAYFEQGEINLLESKSRAFRHLLKKIGNFGASEKEFINTLLGAYPDFKSRLGAIAKKALDAHHTHAKKSPVQQSLLFLRWDKI